MAQQIQKIGSGGVALLISDDVKHTSKAVNNLEDHDQEQQNFCKVFYGPQEKFNKEADRQFS